MTRQLLVKDDGKLMDQSEQVVGLSMTVGSPRDQSRALALIGSVEWIQVMRLISLPLLDSPVVDLFAMLTAFCPGGC